MPRKRKSRKRKIAVLDFETDPFEYGAEILPFAAGLYTGDDYYQFWSDDCANQLADIIEEEHLTVYAHNGGRFDFFFLLERLHPEIFLISNRIAKAKIGDSVLLDSYLILPMPLAAYKKDDIDYGIFKRGVRDLPENKAEILKYLHKDCIYLYEWVGKFIDRFGTKLTVAQAAFDQLSKTGYPCKRRSSEKYDSSLRPFYFGGRTETFKTGFIEGEIIVNDINSAYPSAMRDYHPFGTAHHVLKNPKKLPKTGFYFAVINAVSSGALPLRKSGPDKTVWYPNDNDARKYHTTSWEIRAGLDTGTLEVIDILEVIIYDEVRHFREYVDKFYAEKKAAKGDPDTTKERFPKLMLVSSYGKFGADPRKYKKSVLADWGESPLDEKETGEMNELGLDLDEYLKMMEWEIEGDTEFGKTFWSRPDPGDSYFNVGVAASITGNVRARLWRAICDTEEPFYCDTDSVIGRGFKGKIGVELGEWSIDGEGYKGIYIGGKKLYTMECNYCEVKYDEKCFVVKPDKPYDGEVKKAHKGARLTHEEIVDIVVHGKEITWENSAPSFSLSMGKRYVKRVIKRT